MGHVDRSCLKESEYPLLTKIIDQKSLGKPLQVGAGWPTLVEGEMCLLVPDGGKCYGCETDLSGKIALYIHRNKDLPLVGYEAAVFPMVKDNISCGKSTCIDKVVTNWADKQRWNDQTGDHDAMTELKKFTKNAKFCDTCLKACLNTHRCKYCFAAQYCSQKCRLEDRDWHKTVCETWAKDEGRKMPDRKEQKIEFKKFAMTFKTMEL